MIKNTNFKKIKLLFLSLFVFLSSHHVRAQSKQLYRFSVGLIPLSSSTQQDGNGPKGSTLLTHTEFVVQKPSYWGYGLFYQYDQQGSDQKETGLGLKLEAHYKKIYFDVGYMPMVERVYMGRTYEKETGSGYYAGFGFRTDFYKKYFVHLSYKYRVQTLKKQDDVTLDQEIIQTDSYPLFGLGVSF